MRTLLPAALLAATVLAGCTVGPNYHAPETPVPPAFSGPQASPPGAAIDPATWWTAFGDPQLTSLVEAALKDNPSIAIAASRIRQARYQELQAHAQDKPILSGAANASNMHLSNSSLNASGLTSQLGSGSGSGGGSSSLSGISPPKDITMYSGAFDASWEIDLFGGARRGEEAARATREAMVWNSRDAAVTLAAEVADAYLAFRQDQAQVELINTELQRQQRGLEISAHISQAGLTPDIDVVRQRGSITTTKARLLPIQADMAARLHALGILTGQPPEAFDTMMAQPFVAFNATPAIPAGLPSDLLRRRPDIRGAERQLAAATAQIGVAVADLYPKFSLTGAIEGLHLALGKLLTLGSLQENAGAAINFPIIDWGQRRANVGIRREQREQAYQQYRQTVLTALRDVEDPLAAIDAERQRNAALTQAVADQERTARSVQAQYQAGLVAQDSLLNAQTAVLSSREELIASDAALRQQTVALFKALGGGWSADMALPGPIYPAVDPKEKGRVAPATEQ